MDARVFNMGQFDVQPTLKCKGTFVGHQVKICLVSVGFCFPSFLKVLLHLKVIRFKEKYVAGHCSD